MACGLSAQSARAVRWFLTPDTFSKVYVGPDNKKFRIQNFVFGGLSDPILDFVVGFTRVPGHVFSAISEDTFMRICQFAYFDDYNVPEVKVDATPEPSSPVSTTATSGLFESANVDYHPSSAPSSQFGGTPASVEGEEQSQTSSTDTLPLSACASASQTQDEGLETENVGSGAHGSTDASASLSRVSQMKRPYSLAFGGEQAQGEARAVFEQMKIRCGMQDSTPSAVPQPTRKSLEKVLEMHANVYVAADALSIERLSDLALRHIHKCLLAHDPTTAVPAVLRLADIAYGESLRNIATAAYDALDEASVVSSREQSPAPSPSPAENLETGNRCTSLRDLVARYIALEFTKFIKSQAFKDKLKAGGVLVADVMSLLFD